ncbi:hypothetical protein ScPMuIL_012239 [Solemya velum]
MADVVDVKHTLGSEKQEADCRVKEHGFSQSTEKRKSEDGDEEEGPPEKKKAITMSFNTKTDKKITLSLDKNAKATVTPVKMSLQSQKPKESLPISLKPKSATVAKVFNEDDESDEEEMPPEAKMRMRNIGRNTPTASGPNSFGKGRLGFCDRQKIIERELKSQMDKVSDD